MSIKVSVIIPVYNVEKYLQRALDSVCSQTLKDIEILCIDDGSMDASSEIMKKNAIKDSRIRCFCHEKNRGPSAARNTGMREAHGKYIYFLDSDDWILPLTLELLYQKAEVEKLDILFSSFHQIFENEDVKQRVPKMLEGYRSSYPAVYTGEELFDIFSRNKDLNGMSCLGFYRTNYLKENGIKFYEGIFHEDSLFYPEVLLPARRAAVLDQPFYQYFRRKDSITEKRVTVDHFKGILIVVSELRQWLMTHSLSDGAQKAMEYYIYQCCYPGLFQKYFRLDDYANLKKVSFDTLYQRLDYLQFQAAIRLLYGARIPREKERELAGKHILIYGAGTYGRNIAWQLSRAGINQFTFVVTKKKEGQYFLGSPVHELMEFIEERETAVIILAVGRGNRREMQQNAKLLGFQHIIELEDIF